MYQSAVIDASSLIYLSHLHKSKPIFYYLSNLFHTVYFPSEVVKEFAKGVQKEPHREWVIDRLRPGQGFYRYCTAYDSIVLAIIENQKGIDKGEAESYAQFKKVNAHFIISDDKPFTEALKKLDSSVRIYTSIHLVCWLDKMGLIVDWQEMIKALHLLRPFTSKQLRDAYTQIAFSLGIKENKKNISTKCSLKTILAKPV